MSEHQHLVSLLNFTTVWQLQCTSNSSLLVHQEAFTMFTVSTLITCCIIFQVHPISVGKKLLPGVMSEHQHLVSLLNFKMVFTI